MNLVVSTVVKAPLDIVWNTYISPEHILRWNAASEDWHTTQATSDFQNGGRFCYRMEAKDGSFGFDFEGNFISIQPKERIVYSIGERKAEVVFSPEQEGVGVQVSFEPEETYPLEHQQAGWQAILDSFKRYAESM